LFDFTKVKLLFELRKNSKEKFNLQNLDFEFKIPNF